MSHRRSDQEESLGTLPDYLRAGLDLVFVGINPGLYSVARGHYFARSTSRFWPALSASRLSERMRRELHTTRLEPGHDVELMRFGIGLTDVVKLPTANASGLTLGDFQQWAPVLLNKLQQCQPRVACFHGITAYRPFVQSALKLGRRSYELGEQPERIGDTRLFLVPNPSPANAHFTVAEQTAWYDRLANFLARD